MRSTSITLIDGTRLLEERAKIARGSDAPALASLLAVIIFSISLGLLAIGVSAWA